jgi:hypothetical protein
MPEGASVASDQAAIVTALESGDATGEGRPLGRIDTHMSHLFIGEGRVYKLKRSRRLPFVDMSSLEARRRACEAELAVNRALAPALYEAVLPIVRNQTGAISVGGVGTPIDWVVVMRRFPDGALFDELAEGGRLTPDLVREATAAISSFHASQPSRTDIGHAVDYRRIVDGLRRLEADGAASLGLEPASDLLFGALEPEIAKLAPTIEARRRAGWTRRGHGDLHLRNICIFDGRVTPFDALEFDPALATTDVLYDFAFLLMDLRARGLDGLANVAMNQYWDLARQPQDALALLPLFMALRATVRMAVAVEAADLVQADAYRKLALAVLRPSTPRLLAIGGLSGTGKSTLAAAVAPRLSGPCGARLLRTDVIRKAAVGAPPAAPAASQAYQPEARAAIYTLLAEQAGEALRAGSSVVADGTFREPTARAQIEAASKGHPFLGLWLKAPASVRGGRVTARRNDASDATAAVALEQTEPEGLKAAWRVLDADRTVDRLADDVGALLP